MTKIKIHEGDKEVLAFPIYDSVSGNPIIVDDITAVTFVLVFGSLEITLTYPTNIAKAVSDGVLTVTVTVPVSNTEDLSTVPNDLDGQYQCRVTRGSIGPETVAEGVAIGVLKIEGD